MGDTSQMRPDVLDKTVDAAIEAARSGGGDGDSAADVVPGKGVDFGKAVAKAALPMCDGHGLPCVLRTVRRATVRCVDAQACVLRLLLHSVHLVGALDLRAST